MAKKQQIKKGPAKTAPKQSVSKRATDALSRISALEVNFARFTIGVQEALNQQANQAGAALNAVNEALEGVANLLGRDRVNEAIREVQKKKQEAAIEAAKKALEDLVKQGVLVPSISFGENSLIVGRQIDKDGVVAAPGRVQLQWTQVQPQYQEKLKNNGPGTKIPTDDGGTFEVLEVYDIVPPKEEAQKPASEQTVETTATASE